MAKMSMGGKQKISARSMIRNLTAVNLGINEGLITQVRGK